MSSRMLRTFCRLCSLSASGLLLISAATAQQVEGPASSSGEQVMPTVRAIAEEEPTGKDSLRTTTTSIGKGVQELRDIPQSVTVVTEKLLDDRNLTTMKEALRQTGGVAFLAAEGGEEDIRLRGFSLQSTGDIFIDGMRDPAFYDRDSFNWDRLELLRGSASMLFGRGSTGGIVNQVTKQPRLADANEVAVMVGQGNNLRATADINAALTESVALRVNAMRHKSDFWGAGVDKYGIAPTVRFGIGTNHDVSVGAYYLKHDNEIHYGLPWLTPGPATGGDYLWDTDPKNYYGMKSDQLGGGTTQGNAVWIAKLGADSQVRTAVRVAKYERDQRASAIRFGNAASQPDGLAVNSDRFTDQTVLTRGSNNKIMDMDTQYLQSDYSGLHKLWGINHSVIAGVDLAHEEFVNFLASVPTGVTLAKPVTRVGTPNDGAFVDESLRVLTANRDFDARAGGVFAQDLLIFNPKLKALLGIRFDRFSGQYRNLLPQAGNGVCGVAPLAQYERSDSLPSERFGMLYQPTAWTSFHASYGTSFNTSGDTYQYDPGTVNTPPESSRNIEIGGRIDAESGQFTSRFAFFHSTKYNERNRDADTVNACNYVLSGERHAAGFDADVAGRITDDWEIFASYAFIPEAEVDASSGFPGTETVGARSGLTPRHSGTVWTTYQLTSAWRFGAGLNARSKDTPVGLPAGSRVEAPSFVSGDLLVEANIKMVLVRLNLINVTNEHYAETLYRGHYIPGKPRSLELTTTFNF